MVCMQIFSNTAAVKLVQSQHFVLYKNTSKEVGEA